MSERRNVPEIVIGIRELLRRSQTRIDLLFTMSDIPHAHPAKDDACKVMFRGRDPGKRIVERWSVFDQPVFDQPVFALRATTWQPSPGWACRAEAGAARAGWW